MSISPADRNVTSVTAAQHAAAKLWIDRGQAVIPIGRKSKAPLVGGFAMDVPDELIAERFCTADPWTGRYARAHVGILCGRGPAPLVVVDLDTGAPATTPQHGADVLERLARVAGGGWPETYTVHTPSGGTHLYFLAPANPVPCSVRRHPLIDVKGRGGYVIAAGSTGYRHDPDSHDRPQSMPQWLAAALRPEPKPPTPALSPVPLPAIGGRAERFATAALNGAVADVAAAAAGGRNQLLFARARHLAEVWRTGPGLLDPGEVQARLTAAAVSAGLDERSAARTSASGWNAGVAS